MTKQGAISQLLAGQEFSSPPIWLMRQAGRYLPEYQAVRKKAGSFLNLCFTPDLAMEVTLQPLRRFDLSAAIIFSDILLIPQALGMELDFLDGEGPQLNTARLDEIIAQGFDDGVREKILTKLSPVLTAITMTRAKLAVDKDLIGFAGAPFTIFCYMVTGRSSSDFREAQDFIKARPDDFKKIINILTGAVEVFLLAQLQAGANLVKIFDSWASFATSDIYDEAIYQPHRKIIEAVKKHHRHIITFPKGHSDIVDYHKKTGAGVVALGQEADMVGLAEKLPQVIWQGNLDPMLLVRGGDAMIEAIKKHMAGMKNKSYIFNLGHGINKETPIDNITTMIETIKNFSKG